MLQIGQKVTRIPKTIGVMEDGNFSSKLASRPMRGVVVYVHPKGRFHVVAFPVPGGEIRESFSGVN